MTRANSMGHGPLSGSFFAGDPKSPFYLPEAALVVGTNLPRSNLEKVKLVFANGGVSTSVLHKHWLPMERTSNGRLRIAAKAVEGFKGWGDIGGLHPVMKAFLLGVRAASARV